LSPFLVHLSEVLLSSILPYFVKCSYS
jgi:hypothetical protein